MKSSFCMKRAAILSIFCTMFALCSGVYAQTEESGQDGTILVEGERRFPLGFYELPEDNAGLEAMAGAGVNLVRCRSRADLDRLDALGMRGIMPLPLDQGASKALRAKVLDVAGHPALAVWEGPDEVVWNFTAYSGLYRTMGVHKVSGAWWKQTPEALAYAEEKAAVIIANMREGAAFVRENDPNGLPLWINEALKSDVHYVRQYMEYTNITGCDIYPIKKDKREPQLLGGATDRWRAVGRGMPVYMVLQAFSWDELGEYHGAKETAYPSFAESRLMAYDAIVHGAAGILYWGSHFLKNDDFRGSVYAVVSELDALQPFLVAEDAEGIDVQCLDALLDGGEPHVRAIARRHGGDWLVVVVNEDGVSRMGAVVTGLDALNGRELTLLYGGGVRRIQDGMLPVRMQPLDVQVYCTSRDFETANTQYRGWTFGE